MEGIPTTDKYEYLKRKLLPYLQQVMVALCLEAQSLYSPKTVIIAQLIFLYLFYSFKFVPESSFTHSSSSIFCCGFNSLFHKKAGTFLFFNFASF